MGSSEVIPMNKYITKISLNKKKQYRIDKIKNLVMKIKNGENIEIIPINDGDVGYTLYDPLNMTYTILSADTARPLVNFNQPTAMSFTADNSMFWPEGYVHEIHN